MDAPVICGSLVATCQRISTAAPRCPCCAGASRSLSAEDWPQFRGPDGQGHSGSARSADLGGTECTLESADSRTGLVIARRSWRPHLSHYRHGLKGRSLQAICLDRETGRQAGGQVFRPVRRRSIRRTVTLPHAAAGWRPCNTFTSALRNRLHPGTRERSSGVPTQVFSPAWTGRLTPHSSGIIDRQLRRHGPQLSPRSKGTGRSAGSFPPGSGRYAACDRGRRRAVSSRRLSCHRLRSSHRQRIGGALRPGFSTCATGVRRGPGFHLLGF